MKKHLVLAGAGHAHMVALQNIAEIRQRGHDVTVIGPSPVHYYSGMGPGMLGTSYTPEQISFNSRETVEGNGGRFLQDSVVRIDPVSRVLYLLSGAVVEYDVLSCNCGSTIAHSLSASADCLVYGVKPIENLLAARTAICAAGKKKMLKIGIIGGGPSGAELAGNILQLVEQEKLVPPQLIIFCRSDFMGRFSTRVQEACYRYLTAAGVEIRMGSPVVNVDGSTLITQGEETESIDILFEAQGIKPSPLFAESGLDVGPDGGLTVNQYLQSVKYPDIFGGGDCIHFQEHPLDKVGVFAVRQNPVLYHNLLASLEGKSLIQFSPGGDYLLIFNLGRGYGVLQKNKFFLKGRLAFRIKDYIDRRFMKKFK
jgi:NADH dehydrogenase FAD-containing subunit